MKQNRGGTNLGKALKQTSTMFLINPRTISCKKAVIVITDGDVNDGIDEAQKLRAQGVKLICFAISKDQGNNLNKLKQNLGLLCDPGCYFVFNNFESIQQVFSKISVKSTTTPISTIVDRTPNSLTFQIEIERLSDVSEYQFEAYNFRTKTIEKKYTCSTLGRIESYAVFDNLESDTKYLIKVLAKYKDGSSSSWSVMNEFRTMYCKNN